MTFDSIYQYQNKLVPIDNEKKNSFIYLFILASSAILKQFLLSF